MKQAHRVQIDKALAAKEQVKAGKWQEATKQYYHAVLNVKGLGSGTGGGALGGLMEAARAVSTPPSEGANGDVKMKDVEEEDLPEDDKYNYKNAQQILSQCFQNMATCFAKQEKWESCRRNAECALKEDKDNVKAAFRVAQATVRMGEIVKGRKLLVELKAKSDDAAIATELKILDAAEAQRQKKSDNALRGFMNKPTSPKAAQAPVPKIQEIIGEPAPKIEEIVETPISKAESPKKETAIPKADSPSPNMERPIAKIEN